MSWEMMDLNLIDGGKIVKDVNFHLGKAIEDILDMNKPAIKPRQVTLTIKIIPADDRQSAGVECTVQTKFPTENAVVELIKIARETKTGYVNTAEQIPLGFDPETGEIDEDDIPSSLERIKTWQ